MAEKVWDLAEMVQGFFLHTALRTPDTQIASVLTSYGRRISSGLRVHAAMVLLPRFHDERVAEALLADYELAKSGEWKDLVDRVPAPPEATPTPLISTIVRRAVLATAILVAAWALPQLPSSLRLGGTEDIQTALVVSALLALVSTSGKE